MGMVDNQGHDAENEGHDSTKRTTQKTMGMTKDDGHNALGIEQWVCQTQRTVGTKENEGHDA